MPVLSMLEFETLTVDSNGQPQERYRQSVECLTEDIGQGTTLDLVMIPGGTFLMGASKTEEGWHPAQNPPHEVTIAPFWMGQYPVTQAQWSAVAALPKVNHLIEPQPACFSGANRPIEQVSWLDAIEFCARLSAHTDREYRLPSEAEWEYACRALTPTPFCFGETITTDLANYSGIDWEYEGRICSKGAYGKGPTGDDRRETTDVGRFGVANRFGLYDMHGNVREWCQDCWHPSYANAPTDGTPWISEGDCSQRILRGGSWNTGPRSCRSAARSKLEPDANLYDTGFRIVSSLGMRIK
ncbi:formylglycine-generating enzyme family protein [Kovacikia minuta CCNUW1]|uniref:formylglycine-generating enzyme family protein n=1 Tax=Kovacikia minuta TaxID=2931930 RepID=UPI001CCBBA8E|nr:formylglycine-generating enzyme family protein [Kovacikia minuta]UBF27703.1 formylglycine-generating enzyme family protein [Kovacikia minuta CCNUW1]